MKDTEKLHEILDASADYWQASCAMMVLRSSGGFDTLCLLLLRKHEFLTVDKPADVPIAALVRELTGKSVAEFLTEFVFAQLGVPAQTSAPSDAVYRRYILNKDSDILPPETGDGCFTVSLSELEAFAKALVWGGLLPVKVQRKAETDRSLCGRKDGLHSFNCGEWLRICYSSELDVCFVYLRKPPEEKRNGNWLSFYKDLRREVTAAYMTPQSPGVVPYSRKNALITMNILLHDDQLPFVADARTSICFAFANRKTDRIFVLMDRTQAVGFAQLHIDRKKNEYEIGILQIDKRFQGRGYGRYFLNWCIAHLREKGASDIRISCHERNFNALRLYQSAGFKQAGIKDECIALTLPADDESSKLAREVKLLLESGIRIVL